ncbi:MAG: 3-keto-5-aminohexanoate cleavage protein [Hyphomicrobiales bacterium]|nr:3-keto-5-aminohexanoate cleavage protein [Hyphomicrobiales bacterium]
MIKPFVMVAPTGARRGKADHPALPVTPDEIVSAAGDCFAAGADAIHLHVRDEDGAHTLDAGLYREVLAELSRAVPGMRVQITTESAGIHSVAEQLDCLRRVRPSWASVSVREVAREEDMAARFYNTCGDNGAEIQHILYDEGDARLLARWVREGILPDAPSVLFVLGRHHETNEPTRDIVTSLLSLLPPVPEWMLCAFGRQEHQRLCEAAALGGGLRVGFENSLVDANGRKHGSNAESVRALVRKLGEN